MSKPTPGPWGIGRAPYTDIVCTMDGKTIAECSQQDAARIVKCVNMHDELVSAAKEALKQLEYASEVVGIRYPARDILARLIAKAEAE